MVSSPDSRTDTVTPRWGVVGWSIVIAAFAIGFWQFPLRTVGPTLDHLPGDLVDARLNNYILEHGYRYLNGQDTTFWDVGMFYPTPRVVAYSDAHIGMLPVYASARAVGCTPERSFQIWFLVPFALNYASAILACRRLNATAFTAVVTAYFFAFGVNQVTSLTLHAQLGPRFFVPFALVLGREWLLRPSAGKLLALAACAIGQVYLTIYIGYFLAFVILLQSLAVALLERRSVSWASILRAGSREWAFRISIGILAVLALSPLALQYSRASHDHFLPGPGDVRNTHPTPDSWLYSSRPSVHAAWTDEVFPPIDPMPDECEKQLFPGLVPIAALLFGLFTFATNSEFRRSYPAVAGATVLVGLAIVTNAFGAPPYEPILYLPGAGGIRSIARIVHVLAFPWGLLVGTLLERLQLRVPRFRTAAVFLMLALLIADQWLVSKDDPRAWSKFRFPSVQVEQRRERVVEVIRTHPSPRLVYSFPGENDGEWFSLQVDAMAASQKLGIPTVNGWSGYPPWEWEYFADCRSLIEWLKKRGANGEMLAGLVLIGELTPSNDEREIALRKKFLVRQLAR